MPYAGDGVDRRGHFGDVGAAVLQGSAGAGGRQLDGRHSPVVRVVDPLGGLPDTDDDGGAGV